MLLPINFSLGLWMPTTQRVGKNRDLDLARFCTLFQSGFEMRIRILWSPNGTFSFQLLPALKLQLLNTYVRFHVEFIIFPDVLSLTTNYLGSISNTLKFIGANLNFIQNTVQSTHFSFLKSNYFSPFKEKLRFQAEYDASPHFPRDRWSK